MLTDYPIAFNCLLFSLINAVNLAGISRDVCKKAVGAKGTAAEASMELMNSLRLYYQHYMKHQQHRKTPAS